MQNGSEWAKIYVCHFFPVFVTQPFLLTCPIIQFSFVSYVFLWDKKLNRTYVPHFSSLKPLFTSPDTVMRILLSS